MKSNWERKHAKLRFHDQYGKWWYIFKGVLYAGILLSILNWGAAYCAYKFL